MTDRDDVCRAVAAFDHAAGRLTARGISDADVGRAMVAAGLSRRSRGASAREVIDGLAKVVAGVADAAGVDLAEHWRTEHGVTH